jgi:hypothetical protein
VSTFEIVLIVVGVVGVLLAATRWFRTRTAVEGPGRSAFARPEDRPVAERPSEDDRDEPLPKRPVRARY